MTSELPWWPRLPKQWAQVWFLVRELDCTCHDEEFTSHKLKKKKKKNKPKTHLPQQRSKIPSAKTKTQHGQINDK